MDYHVFCIHHTDNESRKRKLLGEFDALGLTDVEWVETYHPRDRATWDHEGLSSNGSIGETSCALKHRDVYRRMIDREIPLAVVLEDDIELPPTFKQDLERWLEEFRRLEGDMLMIGVSFDLHVDETEPGREVYLARPQTRSTHAYAVTLDCAKVLAPDLHHMPEGIGPDLNAIFEKRGLRMTWVEPGLRQLTMTGDMLSSIETRRTLRDRVRFAAHQVRRRVRK